MNWLFLLIGIAIGAGLATLWFDAIEARLRAELEEFRRDADSIPLYRQHRIANPQRRDRRPW